MFQPRVRIGTLLMTDDADAFAAKAPEAADNGGILAMLAIAGEWYKIGDQGGDVIQTMRPLRMPCDLRLLPGGEPAIEFLESNRRFAFDAVYFFADGN